MASTYAGTASNECLTRAAVVNGVSTGNLFWSGSAQWSSSGRLVTWSEFGTYVDMTPGAPVTNRCPAKSVVEPFFDVLQAPTETPGTPTLSGTGGVLTATWTNTSNAWRSQVVFECITNLMYSGSYLRPAASTSATHDPSNPGLESFRCRLQYFNDAGSGPFSAWSNTFFSQG